MKRLLIAALAPFAFAAPAAAYSNGYLYSRSITVAGSVVPSTQVNFPMLVSGTYSYLATLPNQGMIHNTTTVNSQTVPADLIFTSDAAGTVPLNWEIASYTAATGAIEAWVQIPSLSNGTVIYMFYDNLAVTAFQGNATSAWDTFSQATWHMANGVTQSLRDSTSNGYALTNISTTATSGQIDGGSLNPGGQPDGLYVTSPSGLYSITSFTVSTWVKPVALTSAGGNPVLALITIGGRATSAAVSTGYLSVTIPTNNSYRSAVSTNALTTGAWQYVVFTYSVGSAPRIYLNGAEVSYSSQFAGTGTDQIPSGGAGIGVSGANGYYGNFNAAFDETRIASTSRSANWIATEYNNQSSPSAFYTVGPAVSSGSAAGGASTAVIM